jgi:hypothetical protein
MDDYVFIETINIGVIKDEEFDLSAEENAHLLEDCKTTPDGKILAVKRDKVAPYVNQKDIYLIRMRMRPFPKEFKIQEDEDFWKFMAHLVDIDEDI